MAAVNSAVLRGSDENSSATRDFGQRRNIGSDDRDAGCHGLRDRDTETLVEAGIDEGRNRDSGCPSYRCLPGGVSGRSYRNSSREGRLRSGRSFRGRTLAGFPRRSGGYRGFCAARWFRRRGNRICAGRVVGLGG
jgi:hypothetical protein